MEDYATGIDDAVFKELSPAMKRTKSRHQYKRATPVKADHTMWVDIQI